jgi:hypothetical protein
MSETSVSKGRITGKKVVIIVVGLIVIAIVAVLVNRLPVSADGIDCTAPVGYQTITKTKVWDLARRELDIVQAIISTGDGSATEKVSIPKCAIPDPKLFQNIGGKIVYMEKNDGSGDKMLIYIASGYYMDTNPLSPTAQPTQP